MRLGIHRHQGGRWIPHLLRTADEEEGLTPSVIKEESPVANQLGKRFKCSVCETEVLCVKAGDGAVTCCNKEMEIQEPRPLPSSD